MERVFSILIFLSTFSGISAQQFSIVEEPVCWSIGGVDSSLTRASYISVSGLALTVFYINAAGAAVDVSAGGNLSFGICGCCTNVPPTQTAPYIDTISTYAQLVPIPPNIDSLSRGIFYAEIENITNVSQITAILYGATLPALSRNSVGYSFNAVGAVNFISYTQLTSTKAAIVIDFEIVPYPPNSSYIPVPVEVVADNGSGTINVYSSQFF